MFCLFFLLFLMVDSGAPVAQKLMHRPSPKFQDGLINGCKGLIIPLSFFIFQGTLPWQPTKVEKSAFFPDQSNLSRCHSETDCNIAILISKDSIEWYSLHCVQFWSHLVRHLRVYDVNNSTFCGDTAKIGISRKISQNILDLSWPTLQIW